MLVAVLEGYTSEIDKLKIERDAALKEVERLKAKENEYVGSSNSCDVTCVCARLGIA